jgi:hypothetical protein
MVLRSAVVPAWWTNRTAVIHPLRLSTGLSKEESHSIDTEAASELPSDATWPKRRSMTRDPLMRSSMP